jgi:hypothetical protein
MAIIVEYWPPPIPIRDFDFCAYDDDLCDGATDSKNPHAFGRTRQEALDNLKEMTDER